GAPASRPVPVTISTACCSLASSSSCSNTSTAIRRTGSSTRTGFNTSASAHTSTSEDRPAVGSEGMAGPDPRSCVDAYGRAHPGEVIRVTEPVSIEEDVMALVLEYERRRRFPILLFEQDDGSDMHIAR